MFFTCLCYTVVHPLVECTVMYVPMGALSPTPACLAYVFAFFRNLERFCNCAVVIIINIVFVGDSQPVASRAGGLYRLEFYRGF